MAWFGSSAKRFAPKEPKSGDSATGGLRHPGIHTFGPFGPEATKLLAHSGQSGYFA
jgi:hypothetical protein